MPKLSLPSVRFSTLPNVRDILSSHPQDIFQPPHLPSGLFTVDWTLDLEDIPLPRAEVDEAKRWKDRSRHIATITLMDKKMGRIVLNGGYARLFLFASIAGLGRIYVNANSAGRPYVRWSPNGRANKQLVLSRIIAGAPEGQDVGYRDGDTLNLLIDNLVPTPGMAIRKAPRTFSTLSMIGIASGFEDGAEARAMESALETLLSSARTEAAEYRARRPGLLTSI
ncbi:MAG: hypothetical protein LCH46_13655 [Proteobacteria bacterium]|nr:hypothetical protein [Pseudomonadota bacterium]